MNYNVTEDRADWARVKVALMPPKDREFLMAELIKQNESYALDLVTQSIATGHSERVRARRRVNYP